MATLDDLIAADHAVTQLQNDLARLREQVAFLTQAITTAHRHAENTSQRVYRALTWAQGEDRYLTEGCPSEAHCVRCPSYMPEPPIRLTNKEPGGHDV